MATYRSVLYSFTVTLKPVMYKFKPQTQYDKTYIDLAKLLKSLNCKLTMICEYTKNYNIHYHGVIQFLSKSKDHMKDFYDVFRIVKSFYGFVNIKQIDDLDGWKSYISKELNDFHDRRPIIIDEHEFYNQGFEQYVCYDLSDEQ